jgi:hypothetical protein
MDSNKKIIDSYLIVSQVYNDIIHNSLKSNNKKILLTTLLAFLVRSMAYRDRIINICLHNFIRIQIFPFSYPYFLKKSNTTFVFVFVKTDSDSYHFHFQVAQIRILPHLLSISWIRMSDNMDYPLPVPTPIGVLHMEKFATALRLRWLWLEWKDPDKLWVDSDKPPPRRIWTLSMPPPPSCLEMANILILACPMAW